MHGNIKLTVIYLIKKMVKSDVSACAHLFFRLTLPPHPFGVMLYQGPREGPGGWGSGCWFITAQAAGNQEAIMAEMAGDRGSKMGH